MVLRLNVVASLSAPELERAEALLSELKGTTAAHGRAGIMQLNRADLQLRMQGNAFLGAFFKVSPLLQDFEISSEQFEEVGIPHWKMSKIVSL